MEVTAEALPPILFDKVLQSGPDFRALNRPHDVSSGRAARGPEEPDFLRAPAGRRPPKAFAARFQVRARERPERGALLQEPIPEARHAHHVKLHSSCGLWAIRPAVKEPLEASTDLGSLVVKAQVIFWNEQPHHECPPFVFSRPRFTGLLQLGGWRRSQQREEDLASPIERAPVPCKPPDRVEGGRERHEVGNLATAIATGIGATTTLAAAFT
mmetsp:Transcript_54750/g.124686  ORF Transcript_54750/g.124686 Transcript_54750/m.124686 type:complete len:213 (-) Transcript_54750:664-1302(-)